jgi:NADPH-dependent F420 reductase
MGIMTESTEGAIAIVGGTGKLGSAIAYRLARAGRSVILGSRSAESASATAREIGHSVVGATIADAARNADIIIVTVPFAFQEETLAQIRPHAAGKIVVETTVPLVPPKVMRVQLPADGSAAMRAQRLLGEDVTIVSAFHNVAAHKLRQDIDVQCDVLVFSDDRRARRSIIELVADTGLRGIEGGALANSAAAEALTSVLIFINKTCQVDGAGIQITGQLVLSDG